MDLPGTLRAIGRVSECKLFIVINSWELWLHALIEASPPADADRVIWSPP